MATVTPDTTTRLKPEFIQVVRIICEEFCNIQPGQNVLIAADARTPENVLATFQGMAQSMGATVMRAECAIPTGGATYQPGSTWPKMLAAAIEEADLIFDAAIGYSEIIVNALSKGTRVLCIGDGMGGAFMDENLIRTILHADYRGIHRHAVRIAKAFSEAKRCVVITGDHALELDISDLDGVAGSGFLWDPDGSGWINNWGFLPPAQPGIAIPKSRGTGSVEVDGTVLYHHEYHEAPATPMLLTFKDGRLTDIGGDRILSNRIRNWLESLDDEGAWGGPVHLNVGLSPEALLTQGQEWERVYGSLTCGMGDFSLLGGMLPGMNANSFNKSRVHWDWTVLMPRVELDGKVLCENGRFFID